MMRKILGAQILQQKPIFTEEWLNKTGSLSAPDPATGETFSRAWMKTQKQLWNEGISNIGGSGGESPSGIAPPSAEEEAEYVRRKNGGK
jgi:hypothetical protein